MSVTFAPRARIAVNAAWPGVSRKVMLLSPRFTLYAPMCCVMPPASPAATRALRIASSSEVFPWSTWPIIVMIGGRSLSSAGFSSVFFLGGSTTTASTLWTPSPVLRLSRSNTAPCFSQTFEAT
jgi:hypothetical protein